MYDVPVYTSSSYVEIAEIVAQEPLVAGVEEASYDAAQQMATVRIREAFEFRAKIKKYHQPYILLIYRGHVVDVAACPVVKVPFSRIDRDFPNIFKDTVTLHISGIAQMLADEIETAKCLQIETPTVRRVVG